LVAGQRDTYRPDYPGSELARAWLRDRDESTQLVHSPLEHWLFSAKQYENHTFLRASHKTTGITIPTSFRE
jgi:hypothetical protein